MRYSDVQERRKLWNSDERRPYKNEEERLQYENDEARKQFMLQQELRDNPLWEGKKPERLKKKQAAESSRSTY